MIQPTFDDWPTFRRHYTRLELNDKLTEVRRRCGAPNLCLVADNDISDQTAIAVAMGSKEKLRLTPWLSAREMFIALHTMTLLPRIWDYEKEHLEVLKTEPVSRVQAKAFGRKKT